jgi:hypothetical protein
MAAPLPGSASPGFGIGLLPSLDPGVFFVEENRQMELRGFYIIPWQL